MPREWIQATKEGPCAHGPFGLEARSRLRGGRSVTDLELARLASELLTGVTQRRPDLVPLAAKMASMLRPARHSPDFTSAVWFGASHAFTASQSAVVRLLWTAWSNGTPDIRHEYLLESVGSAQRRLIKLFGNHSAWGTMIQPGLIRGTCRLAEPDYRPPGFEKR